MVGNNKPLPEPVLEFGEFRLDPNLRCLYRHSEPVKLTPKPFDTLEFLIANRHRVVPKAELLDQVWGQRREASTIEQAIRQLRKSLGDDAENPRFIQTLAGQGYRFIAEVQITQAPSPSPALPPSLPRFRLSLPWLLAGLGTLLAALIYVYARPLAPVTRVTISGNTLLALSATGTVLWKHVFESALEPPTPGDEAWSTQIVDLDRNGQSEVLFTAAFAGPDKFGEEHRGQELFCFSSQGKILWRYQPQADFAFKGNYLNGPWRIAQVLVVSDDPGNSIWVAVSHAIWWPSFIARISPTGQPANIFTSSGLIFSLLQMRAPSGNYVLAAGVNNGWKMASLAVLPVRGSPSSSPQTEDAEYRCLRGCPSTKPFRYYLFPPSELSVASGLPYNWAVRLRGRPGGAVVQVTEAREPAINAFYALSDNLQLESVAFSDGYAQHHKFFERLGRIDHSYENCPERSSPAAVRMADENGAWRQVLVPRP